MKKALVILAGALLATIPLVTANVALAYFDDGEPANPAFYRCPWPRTCMAPCQIDAPATVLCIKIAWRTCRRRGRSWRRRSLTARSM